MHGYVFTMQYPCGWVSPFGHRRIKACCQLPDAFRRLPRPSSPLTAKASTVCAYSLDHITPSYLKEIRIPANGTTYSLQIRQLALPALASTTRCRHSSKTLATSRFSKNMPRPQCQGISKCVCADHSEEAFASLVSTRLLVACHGFLGQGAAARRWREPMSGVATQPQESVVGLGGLEPPASPLSGARSNHLSYRPNVSCQMVEPVGIEPTTPCLQSRCSPS